MKYISTAVFSDAPQKLDQKSSVKGCFYMAKYNLEMKLKLINEYKQCKNSMRGLARKYNINIQIISAWIKMYEKNGIVALKRSRKKREYSTEFKLDIVTQYLTTDISYQDLAIKYGINNHSLIARWKLDYEKNGIIGLQSKKKGRPPNMKKNESTQKSKVKDSRTKQEKLDDKLRIKELEAKLEYAEAENAVLKKFHALGIPIPESMRKKK